MENHTSKLEIKPIGSFLETDSDGFIVNTTSIKNIQPNWMPAVQMIKDAYLKNLGEHLHSVYIRGSVAKGKAIENISDIDSFAVVNLLYNDIDSSWTKDFAERLIKDFPFITGVEMGIIPFDEIKNSKGDQIMIKTQSICIHGKNLANMFPSMKPGIETAQHFQGIAQEIDKTKEWLQKEHTDEEICRRCTWIMKRILRCGFELIMERSQKYTRDLYLCYEEFSKYYPDKESQMREVLDLAINPVADKNQIKSVLDSLVHWLVSEIPKHLEIKK
jgi:uncharacterized protein